MRTGILQLCMSEPWIRLLSDHALQQEHLVVEGVSKQSKARETYARTKPCCAQMEQSTDKRTHVHRAVETRRQPRASGVFGMPAITEGNKIFMALEKDKSLSTSEDVIEMDVIMCTVVCSKQSSLHSCVSML